MKNIIKEISSLMKKIMESNIDHHVKIKIFKQLWNLKREIKNLENV